ncbi:MAG: protoporphyrinogen oxidase [Elusimicrobia bacterium]|nr:protoporphyrinogen oxidase [Elusimicrobiota bacterium]
MSRTVVIGGGICGLACAYDLAKAGREVVLLEADGRLGGKILSDKAGGHVFEAGPDSFITQKPWGLQLVRELGLEGRLLPTSETEKDVFAFTRGRLRRYPDGLMLMAPAKVLPFLASDLVPFSTKLRMGLEYLLPRGAGGADESLGAFTRRRFGAEALEVIVGPVMAGIYAGDPDRLSMAATFPQFCEMEREHGSVMRGLRLAHAKRLAAASMASEAALPRDSARSAAKPKPGPRVTMFMALDGGLSGLVDALAAKLPPGAARTGAPVTGLARSASGWTVTTAAERFDASAVVLALPASAASRITRAVDERLDNELARIDFVSTATLSLAYPAGAWKGRLKGFGFVVDRREARAVVAGTYSSSKFPGRSRDGSELLRIFLGGAGREEVVAWNDAKVLGAVRADLKRILGADPEPETARVYRWPASNPQYNVGHQERVARLEALMAAQPGLLLAGSSYKGVGIPDCVRSGREAAKRVVDADGRPDGGVA